MTADPTATTPPLPPPFPLFGLWLESWKAADAHGRAVVDWYAAAFDPQAARKRWLEAMSEAADAYLRSPAFLDAMRAGSTTAAEFRAAQAQAAQDALRAWGLPTVADLDVVAERVRRAERSLAARLDELDERLDSLTDRRPPE